ncbi:MAG: HAD family phosphatase [Pseudomonadota bacterium]
MNRVKTHNSGSNASSAVSLDEFSLIIFDFDGVIADSEIISLATLQNTLADYGIHLPSETVRERFLGKSLDAILEFVAENSAGRPVNDFAENWQSELFERFHNELSPIADVTGFLDILRSLNVPYCIASSGTFERIGVALAAMQMAPLFEFVFSAEQVERGKPAPDLFLHAAAQVGVAPETCLVIEDSPFGVRAAKAANMRCAGFVGGAHLKGIEDHHGAFLRQQGADLIIRSYGALAPELCKKPEKQ